MRTLKINLLALALILVAPVISRADDKWKTPGDFFKDMASSAGNVITFTNIDQDFPELKSADRLLVFFGAQDELPTPATRLDQWSERDEVSSGFPVVYNSGSQKLELAHSTLEKSSAAMQSFVFYFCRAYNRLPSKLARSGSPLAIGAAALAASDVLYPTAHAILPTEVVEPAAMVRVLSLEEPSLLNVLFEGKGDVEKLVTSAVSKMTAIPNANPSAGPLIGFRDHQDLAWLITGLDGARDVTFEDFVGVHPMAARGLTALCSRVANIRLRAYILEGVYRAEFGSPSIAAEALPPWEVLFGDLMEQTKKDLAARKNATRLAPAFDANHLTNIIVADPNLLTTLFSIASELEAGGNTNSWTREKLDAMDETSLLALLQASPHTRQMLELAGSIPQRSIARESESGGRTNILCRVVFGPMVRPYPSDLNNSPEKLMNLVGFEGVTCIWWRPDPVGEGKPFFGVHADTLVTLVEGSNFRRVRAREIKPGDRILGFAGLPAPDSTNEFSLNSKLKLKPFTVVKITTHQLRQHVALILAPYMGKAGSILVTPKVHIVNSVVGTNGLWRSAGEVDPNSLTWAGEITAKINAVAKREFPPGEGADFIEIVLASQKRKEANNFAVSLNVAGPEVAVVEAGPITSSSIPPDEPIEVAEQPVGQTIVVGQLRPDPRTQGKISGTALAGYYVRNPEEDSWPNPPLTRHTTWALNTNGLPQQLAYKLHFEDDTVLTLGELSWVLTYADSKISETCVSPVTLKLGSAVVTGVNGANFVTATLKSREPILFNPGERPTYALLATANLSYVKVGPILVATEDVPLDEATEGVMVGSKLALVNTNQTTNVDPTVQPRAILPETLVVSPDNLVNKEVASLDPFVTMKAFADTVLGPPAVATSSRTVIVKVIDPHSQTPLLLRVAPAQGVLVQRRGRVFGTMACELESNDNVFIAVPGYTAPVAVTVQCVTPEFHLPDWVVARLTRKLENIYTANLLPTGIIAFDDGFATLLSEPGVHKKTNPAPLLEGDGPGRSASGKTVSDAIHGWAETQPDSNMRVMVEPPGDLVDKITLSEPVQQKLRQRRADLISSFETEKLRLGPLPAGHQKFWNHYLREQPQKLLDAFNASNPQFSETNNGVTNSLAKLALELPYETNESEGMERWMKMLLSRREKFINDPTTARFSEVVFLETVYGSWLNSMGGTTTADLLQREIVQLSLLTACDPDRSKVKARVKGLKLLLLLQGPTFISASDPSNLDNFTIDTTTADMVKQWGSMMNVVMVSRSGTVSVPDIQVQLDYEIGKAVPPFISGIPTIGPDGELVTNIWTSVRPVLQKDFLQNGRELKNWLSSLALNVSLGYADPPPWTVQASHR